MYKYGQKTKNKDWQTKFIWLGLIVCFLLILFIFFHKREIVVPPPSGSSPAGLTNTINPELTKPMPEIVIEKIPVPAKDGADGKDGKNGRDGKDGKSLECRWNVPKDRMECRNRGDQYWQNVMYYGDN